MKRFILRCTEIQPRHPDIELPDLLPISIGRSLQTKITDSRLSRNHIRLTANVSKKQVFCQIIGSNRSILNQKRPLKKYDTAVLKSGDKLELLEDKFEYVVLLESRESMNSKFSNHWSQGLYASMNDKDLLVYNDDEVCIIKDKYPKALKHFLVLPKEKLSTLYEFEWPKHEALLNVMETKTKELIGKIIIFGFIYKDAFPFF